MKLLTIGDLHGKIPPSLKHEISKIDFDFIIGLGDYSGIDDWRPYVNYYLKLKKGKKRKSAVKFFGLKKFNRLVKKDFEAGKKVLKFLDGLGKPGFFIFGNGDDGWYRYPFSRKILQVKKSGLNFLTKLKNLREMTYQIKTHKGISFLGFGGYMDATANDKSRDKEWQNVVNKRTAKAGKKMSSLIKKITKSVFILHYPPKGVFDKISDRKNPAHGGSTGVNFFREAIIKKKPFLVLCGHMHEYQGKKKLGASIVVNPGEGAKGKFAIIDIDEKTKKVRKIQFIK